LVERQRRLALSWSVAAEIVVSHFDFVHFVLLEVDGLGLYLHSHEAAVHAHHCRGYKEQAVYVDAESYFDSCLTLRLRRDIFDCV